MQINILNKMRSLKIKVNNIFQNAEITDFDKQIRTQQINLKTHFYEMYFYQQVYAQQLKIQLLLALVGTQMDYVEDDTRAEFVFNNPNQKGTCGCGKSFHV
eukprot:TRINITY_DN3950_c0_g1_i6.p2 TRINITY_DN3950_c0_g1~~TRINITY_DN3950_c0_g1_i6.p2  ORF type:complete len:101 (-),score=10.10 TRINITY_DN3950_c0_g1_i6:220-522(-)